MEVSSYYTLQGDKNAKTIVFLHGFLEDSSVWQSLAEKLSGEHQVLCIDLLGHGKTPVIAEVHTMKLMAAAVRDVLQKEGIRRCSLVGHSMGGYVALAFAELYPEMVEGLALMNSTTLPDSEEKKKNRDRVLKIIPTQKELFVRAAVTNLFSTENQVAMKDALEKLIAIGMATNNEGIKAASLGMKVRLDRTIVFEQLTAKKHIFIGATYSLLSGGHLSYIENEAETLEALLAFTC